MSDYSKNTNGDNDWGLKPLTPEYLEEEHGGYVRAIENALNNPQIRNIALSGNYGVGKSSILQQIANSHKDRVVELSLSTLAPIEDTPLDESVPKQAATRTNQIQQEIVKQLLYREQPKKTPGSRFRRIERFNWWRELAIASLTGLPIVGVSLITGWTSRIQAELPPLTDLGVWIHLLIFGLATSAIMAVRYLLHGRVHFRQVSAGSATVTLDDKSVSYFDQYLDEIVYFFEVSRRDIVIFEDIDRFNDSRIFETLRSLNTLLNASPQTDTPIRFIYAIKDSIFDRIGLELEGRKFEPNASPSDDPAQAEAVRANRTKFFDLVIPVVPFITHRSAKSLTVQHLNTIDNQVDPELIDLAARYVPDMRLLKNVCNEFIVFRNRVFAGEGEHLNLSETSLFAMMLYKSTHLTDFEAVRLGQSNLDQVYELGRNLVVSNIKRIEREERTARQRLSRIDSITARSRQLGDQLIAHANRVIRAARFDARNGQYTFEGQEKSEEELRGAEFWTQFVDASDENPLHWRNRNNPNQKFLFTRSDIAEALDTSLNPKDWHEVDRSQLMSEIEKHRDDKSFLRSADMGDLINRPEFTVEYMDEQHSLDDVSRQLFTEGLVYHLISAGYIDRNFTLYTSTFHGERVSSAATNFIIHHVERDVMDEYFELDDNDVEAVIRERGKTSLQDPALYNIAVLDYLLRTDRDGLTLIINSLARLGDIQKRFLQAYLSEGDQRIRLVACLTPQSPWILVHLISQADLDDPVRRDLVSTALENLVDNVKYRTNSDVKDYLEYNSADITALTSGSVGELGAERIGNVLSDAGIRVHALEPLSEAVQEAFIAQNRYVINRENLTIALGSTDRFPLDIVRSVNTGIYDYVVENLDAYLSAIGDVSPTVDSAAPFSLVLEDVLVKNRSQIDAVVENASADCIITDLEELSNDVWPSLAYHGRFSATLQNISLYIKAIGSIDINLARLLNASGLIIDHEDDEDEDKRQLALTILSASEYLPSAELRVQLVASMTLGFHLEASDIPAENGEFFSLLLKHDIIDDNADTFEHLSETDWSTREAFIRESERFKEYMTPALVQDDAAKILSSKNVDIAVKMIIAEHASDYIVGSGKKGLVQLAQFASQHERVLTLDVVEDMAVNGVPANDVMSFLKPHLSSASSDQLFRILESLGGGYSKLTSTDGGKPKISNTEANCALIETLKEHGIVSSYEQDADRIKINKRRK